MANFSYKQKNEVSLSIKGVLADEDTVIVTEKDGDHEVSLKAYLNKFIGGAITISVKNTTENNLSE